MTSKWSMYASEASATSNLTFLTIVNEKEAQFYDCQKLYFLSAFAVSVSNFLHFSNSYQILFVAFELVSHSRLS